MPVSIVVGGQYGSEGKGKVALHIVRRDRSTTMVVRPGGSNSGHTAYNNRGDRLVLRQLPVAVIDRNVQAVLPAGAYIDVALLQDEIARVGLQPSQVLVDPKAHVIRRDHSRWEQDAGLIGSIGSTGSGTGAAVISRIARFAPQQPVGMPASECEDLQPFLVDTGALMEAALRRGERILIEGTQGFGLSVLHSEDWPKCTSRDTTAAGLLSEAGLGPLEVDQVVLVLRCHPIRVAGDSGPLPDETSWEAIASESGLHGDLREFTSVTQKLRRVGRFNPGVVRRAIRANSPTELVLNHLDYVDSQARGDLTERARSFVTNLEVSIDHQIDWIGLGPNHLVNKRTVIPA